VPRGFEVPEVWEVGHLPEALHVLAEAQEPEEPQLPEALLVLAKV